MEKLKKGWLRGVAGLNLPREYARVKAEVARNVGRLLVLRYQGEWEGLFSRVFRRSTWLSIPGGHIYLLCAPASCQLSVISISLYTLFELSNTSASPHPVGPHKRGRCYTEGRFGFAVSPVIRVPNQLVGAPRGTDVALECLVEASPKSINYWVKDPPRGKKPPDQEF